MRKLYILFFLLTLSCFSSLAQNIAKRLVLIGNAGAASSEPNNILELIKLNVPMDSNTIVVYLGNNVNSQDDTVALLREVAVVDNTDAKAFFIPGFYDWARGKESGYKAVKKQEKFLKGLNKPNIKFYPGDGCPGPKDIDLGNDIEMVIMDSQWWLHEHTKPNIESGCKCRTKEELLDKIEDLPKDKYDKLVLFVTHHPVMNTGVHSGGFALKQHLFPLTDIPQLHSLYLPLPIVGSLYPMARNAIYSKQNMTHKEYQSYVNDGIRSQAGVKRAFREHPHTIFISGQESNTQLLKDGEQYFIVSGATGEHGRVRNTRETIYNNSKPGYAVLEISTDRKVTARFFELDDHRLTEKYRKELLDYSTLPPMAEDTATLPKIERDSATVAANEDIAHARGLKRLLIGDNNRELWGKEVKMKVFHINEEKGGLKVTGIGGGHESTSLQMEDKDGKKWVLRSVNKNLEAVIPEGFYGTIASDYIHDILSGVNPYGSLVVPTLQEPLDIVHAKPELFYVPNDTALGYFKPLFANTVAQLEERKPAINENELKSTTESFNDMVKESDHLSDQKAYLKARLVDFLISDFDRHHNQYSWGTIDSNGRKLYYPIPKDRDQALYDNTGLLVKIAKKKGYKFMTNFHEPIDNIVTSGIVGAYLDMMYMNRLDETDWREVLGDFRTRLSDTVLANAAKHQPKEVYAVNGKETEKDLKRRRDNIVTQGLDYYKFVSKKVPILGGNKDELFKVTSDNKDVKVQVFTKDAVGNTELKYERSFDPNVTHELRLFGFNGDDYFDIDESVNTKMRLKIVGGRGDDTFNVQGRMRNHLFDSKLDNNEIIARRRTTKIFTSKPYANEFVFRNEVHNSFRFPKLMFGFNDDDGVFAGIGLSKRTYGFKKYPYSTRQSLNGLVAFSNRAYRLGYTGEFIHVFRRYDLIAQADVANPTLANFFGLGNETVRDATKVFTYYRARYGYLSADVLARRRFLNDTTISFSIGPSFYRYWNEQDENMGRILENPSLTGLDPADVYATKSYLGGKAILSVANLNSQLLPTRGIDWSTELTILQNMDENAEPLTKLQSKLDLYAELVESRRLLAALHLGGGHIFSSNFEYFQAMSLGSNNYLRGYRVNRFSGSSMAYGSVEVKAKLFNINGYLLKGDFGLVGFNDFGRVWVRNERSDKWHHGYGGGIYLVPFQTVMVSFLAAMSEEDKLFNLTVGTNLNMVFQGKFLGGD